MPNFEIIAIEETYYKKIIEAKDIAEVEELADELAENGELNEKKIFI